MAGITLAQAEAKLAEALDAETKALLAESYQSPEGSRATRNLEAISKRVEYWQSMVNRLSRGGIRITGGTPT